MPLRMSRKARKAPRRASVETLEKRTLLTAIVNGLFTGTNSIYEGGTYYEYKQADDTTIRISVQGNVTAEFIGGRVPEGTGTLIIRDLVPAIVFNDEGELVLNDEDGVNLFSIYVLRSDANSIISISALAADAPDAEDRFMDPFSGSAGEIRFFNENSAESETISLPNGAVYIGARTDFDAPFDNLPIITTNRRSFGLRPASAGQMFAGLEVAPGNNLGMFLLGGTITGMVDVSGNIRTFYAGNILTGDAGDIGELEPTPLPRNFFIDGDIENLLTLGSFGTISLNDDSPSLIDIDYKTGFDLHVRGRVGQVWAADSFLGNALVDNDRRVLGLGLAQREIEFRGPELSGFSSYFDPVFGIGEVGLGDQIPNPAFFNDSFDTPQYLGTLFSSELNTLETIQIRGFTHGDPDVADHVDYYAVALVGGQTVQVQLLETTYRVGVFDPDGRLIATDYNGTEFLTSRLNQPFRFTADRPGSYRIAIARAGDINFNGIVDPGENVTTFTSRLDYELRISRVADIAFGGLIAGNHIATTDSFGNSIRVRRGDLGQVQAGVLDGTVFSLSSPWTIDAGNLRAIEGNSIGVLEDDTFRGGSGVDFIVPRGTVGLLRTFGTDLTSSILVVNDDYSFSDGRFIVVTAFDDITLIDPSLAVGVDIQLVDSASNLTGNLLANRAIGTIRAVDVASNYNGPPVWSVNVDNIGDDGRIDLIQVSNSFGRLAQGGPAIATGPNGNVRYIHVTSSVDRNNDGIIDIRDLLVFTDRFFGGGAPQVTTYERGETARLTDDSGTDMAIVPIPLLSPTDPDTGLPLPGLDNPGFLRIVTYPIRDKAGVAVINVTSYPGVNGAGRGVEVRSGARGRGGTVEIGEIEVRSPGTEFVFDEFTRTFSAATGGQNSDVILGGPSPVDVWLVEGRQPASDVLSGLTRVLNAGPGEMVNVTGAHIGTIEGETVGLARQSTGAAVLGQSIQINAFPFNQQRNLVVATGHIPNIRARQGVGNIAAIGGSIGTINANADRRNVRGVHEGINGPIYATQTSPPTTDAGNIVSVNIGEGILPTGTGDVSYAGLYADQIIDRVINQGEGSDIRGNIVASGIVVPATRTVNGVVETTPEYIIGRIILRNASIIDANIMIVTSLAQSRENTNTIVITDTDDPLNQPIFDIGSIEISGIGGIIGSQIAAADVGPIIIDGGFGLITSSIVTLGDGTIDGVITDGYGVRTSLLEGGARVNRVIARGVGKRIDTRFYTATVRYSERMSFDPYSGLLLDAGNDLHRYLGTTASQPKRVGFSDAGVIEDTQIVGQRTAGLIEAHRIIGRNVFTTVDGRRRRIPFGSLAYPMRISFGQGVDTVRTRDIVDGLALTGGGINLFAPGNDVHYTAINTTGRIRNIIAGGALRGTSSIKAFGSEGTIDNISTRRSLFATIETSLNLGTLSVGTYLGSPLIRVGRNMTTLRVGNSIVSGADVTIRGNLGELIIGENLEAGATVRANSIGRQQIGGQVLGDIIIT